MQWSVPKYRRLALRWCIWLWSWCGRLSCGRLGIWRRLRCTGVSFWSVCTCCILCPRSRLMGTTVILTLCSTWRLTCPVMLSLISPHFPKSLQSQLFSLTKTTWSVFPATSVPKSQQSPYSNWSPWPSFSLKLNYGQSWSRSNGPMRKSNPWNPSYKFDASTRILTHLWPVIVAITYWTRCFFLV